MYDKENRALQFVEAKHYDNPELRSKSTPKVISQIKRYENQIKKSRSSIIKQYKNYIKGINKLFKSNLDYPKSVEEKVILCVMGFDSSQATKIKNDFKEFPASKGIKYYQIGNPKSIKLKTLWGAKTIV